MNYWLIITTGGFYKNYRKENEYEKDTCYWV